MFEFHSTNRKSTTPRAPIPHGNANAGHASCGASGPLPDGIAAEALRKEIDEGPALGRQELPVQVDR